MLMDADSCGFLLGLTLKWAMRWCNTWLGVSVPFFDVTEDWTLFCPRITSTDFQKTARLQLLAATLSLQPLARPSSNTFGGREYQTTVPRGGTPVGKYCVTNKHALTHVGLYPMTEKMPKSQQYLWGSGDWSENETFEVELNSGEEWSTSNQWSRSRRRSG